MMEKNTDKEKLKLLKINIEENKAILIWAVLFAAIYSLIVFFNHYCFLTYALDLGVYTSAIYDYSHFQWNDATVFKTDARNLLSDHLDLSLMVISPLSYVFGTYTLLIAQIVYIITGAFGVYRYILVKTENKQLAIAGFIHLCLFFGVFSALSFDYHSNVLAAMIFPWLFYFLHKQNYRYSAIVVLFMLICKESVALWLSAACLAMIIEFRKDKKAIVFLSISAILSLVYFVLAVKFIMPALSPGGEYSHYKYNVLGRDYKSAFSFIITHPLDTFRLLFVNHSGNVRFDWVKTEFYIFILVSGGFLVFIRPAFLLMMIVPLIAKMCYNDPAIWSIDCHYSIEFAPIITLCVFSVIADLKSKLLQKRWMYLSCVLSLVITIRLMDHTVYLRDYNRLRLYQKGHYTRAHDIAQIHKAIKMIPNDATVSAQSPILPHLAYRDKIYQFPIVKDAEYIIASFAEPVTYPIQKYELKQMVSDSIKSGRWEVLQHSEDVSLLRRIK